MDSSLKDPVKPSQAKAWLSPFSFLVAMGTLVLILAGGLVTSHEAGLAVPDWPMSYGRWFPPMVGNIFWEHGHRMIAGIIGILTLALAIVVQIYEPRKPLKALAWTAAVAVLLQAVLGGLTVIYMLPPPISIAHATLAQTFFCLVVSLAYFLGGYGNRASVITGDDRKRLKRLIGITAGLIYLQLILGATVRHTGAAVVFHIGLAVIIAIHVVLVNARVNRTQTEDPFLSNSAISLGFMVMLQFFLGLAAYLLTQVLRSGYAPSLPEVIFASAHQTLGAVILATAVLMTIRVWR